MIVTNKKHHGAQHQFFVQKDKYSPKVHVAYASPGLPLIFVKNHAIEQLHADLAAEASQGGTAVSVSVEDTAGDVVREVVKHVGEVFGKAPSKIVHTLAIPQSLQDELDAQEADDEE